MKKSRGAVRRPPPPKKTPMELVREMEYMVKLHDECMWAVVMEEAAECIRELMAKSGK